MPRGRASRRLEQLAAPLKPEREPFYVRQPVGPGLEDTYPAEGWYWIPEHHHVPVYLGSGEVAAAVNLHRKIQELTA